MLDKKILLIQAKDSDLRNMEKENFKSFIPDERKNDLEVLNFMIDDWQNFHFDANKYSHIICSGSNYNISYGIKPWFDCYKKIIIDSTNKNIPIFGVCFGMQFICYAFGSKLIEKKDKKEGGRIKVQTQNTKNTFFDFLPNEFYTNAFHTDFVIDLHNGFENFGFSENCTVQIVQKIGFPVFGVQFHPEFNKEYIKTALENVGNKYTSYSNEKVIDETIEHYFLKDKVSELLTRFLRIY